jgi:hypothetical protein
MSSPRTETTPRPADTEESTRTTLNVVQISAGALAAVSSAVVASFFGVAGTLVGAALASVISTICATLYSESLKKTNERLRAARQQLANARPTTPAPVAQQPRTQAIPTHLDPRRSPDPRRRPRGIRVAGYAAAVFGLAMGILTGVELIGQQPVSALVGGASSSETTTIGSLTNASSSRDSTPTSPSTTTPAPSTAQDTAPTTAPDPADDGSSPSSSEASTSTTTRSPTTSAEPTPTSTQAPQRSGEQPDAEADTTP